MNQQTKNLIENTLNVSRRSFLTGAATAAALTLIPGQRLYAASGLATIPTPPNFPAGIVLYQQTYINWAKEIIVSNVWTCSPATANDVVTLANWAKANKFRLRPLGSAHGFAPTILPRASDGANYLLVNTMDHLNKITVSASSNPKSVTAQAGATIEEIAVACKPFNLGFRHTPAPGGVTIAGGLAMNVHGAALPATGQTLNAGHSFGTLSNLVLSITAVVWNSLTNKYVLRTFQRYEPDIGPLLTCLARAFITEVKLQMGPLLNLRCLSRVDITPSVLFAPSALAGPNAFAQLVSQYGSVEALVYPFVSDTCWVKLWQVASTKPSTSRAVPGPYNYPAEIPDEQATQIAYLLRTRPAAVPGFCQQSAAATKQMFTPVSGDSNTQIYDIWGPAYYTTMYVKPNTLRLTTAAWGVILKRSNLQRAFNEFYNFFTQTISTFAAAGQYPYTGPFDVRAHGLDRASDVQVIAAIEPHLSGARPIPSRSDLDTVIWFALNNNVDQPGAAQFNTQMEQFFLSNYSSYAVVRPEWTKAYAYTATGVNGGGWTNTALLTQTYPNTFRNQGYTLPFNWDGAVSKLKSYDPNKIFSNPFLDTLMP